MVAFEAAAPLLLHYSLHCLHCRLTRYSHHSICFTATARLTPLPPKSFFIREESTLLFSLLPMI
jgi:hypothetical protein